MQERGKGDALGNLPGSPHLETFCWKNSLAAAASPALRN